MARLKREEIDFLIYDWLDVESLSEYERFADHGRETYDPFLDLCVKLAENEFLPSYKAGDQNEPQLRQDGTVTVAPEIASAVRSYVEAGIHLASFDEAHGGMGMPMTISSASKIFFEAANIAAGAYAMLSQGNTRLLLENGTDAQIEAFAMPQLAGETLGTMALSEPQAGSSLGDITTKAVPDGEDELGARYRLFGRKMWISGADHDITDNIVHLVLAKVPNEDGSLPPGTKGISIFAVPKQLPEAVANGEDRRNDVVTAGLNHKMGYRGTTNCLLNLGEGTRYRPLGAEGAVGWRLGEIGGGLPIMFQMMNEARIGVGLGGASLAWRGYLLSCEYALDRTQGRTTEDRKAKDQVPLTRHADVRRMLLAQKAYAEGGLALCLYSAKLVDIMKGDSDETKRQEAEKLLALLTPVNKTFPSEFGPEANSLAIQVHGGYGYTRDFDVEQLYRDNRLNPIHEGTTGIQAMDLLGRKIAADQGEGLKLLAGRMNGTIEAARGDEELSPLADRLAEEIETFSSGVREELAKGDLAAAMANATPVLFAFGHLVVGWHWLDQALAAKRRMERLGADDALAKGKIAAARYFYDFEMPRIAAWLSPFAAGSTATRHLDEAIFAA